MEFLKYVSLIPVIMQLFEKGAAIRQKVRDGESVLDLLKAEAPTLIELFTAIAKAIFPNLATTEAQVQAGALTIDISLVKTIQANLNKLGAEPQLVADGAYGAKTKAAVTAFQTKHGLDADGWAGRLTQAKIAEELAKLPA